MKKEMTRRDFVKGTAALTAAVALAGLSACAAEETPKQEEKQPLHVKAAFFSPTEGTRNAVGMLAAKISTDVEYIDLTTVQARNNEVTFTENELAIVAAPSYGGQIPMIEGLFSNLKGENTPCVVVCSFGNRAAENVYAQIANQVSQQGFVVVGAIGLVTPHVFSEKAGHSRPNIEDNQKMQEFANQLMEKLNGGAYTAITLEGTTEVDWEKKLSVAQKEYREENCTRCMECVKNCPVSAINEETMEIDESICLSCQRCTFVCQFNGRSYDTAPVRAFIESKLASKKPVEYFL